MDRAPRRESVTSRESRQWSGILVKSNSIDRFSRVDGSAPPKAAARSKPWSVEPRLIASQAQRTSIFASSFGCSVVVAGRSIDAPACCAIDGNNREAWTLYRPRHA